MTKYLILVALGAIFSQPTWAIDANCDFFQDMVPGNTHFVFNNEFPNRYTAKKSCRWLATSPTSLQLSCQEFDLPASNNCAGDRVSISPTGNLQLTDAQNFCGRGTFNITSRGNNMNIVFTALAGTTGGRFLCRLAATAAVNPNCDCGWKKQTRIVGGTNAGTNEFPMMAGIVSFFQGQVICGGTIISSKYALTAAHCLLNKRVDELGLLVGDHDTSTGTDTSAAVLHAISTIRMHPSHNSETGQNDIGIVATVDPILFSAEVGPACLPFQYVFRSFVGEIVDVLGWGTKEFAGEKSDVLQKVKLNVVDISTCQRAFPDVTTNQLCTFTPGKDSCQMDSGGPVLWQNPDDMRVNVVGIIGFGSGCGGDSPGVNTRVGPYIDWIVSNTPGTNLCKV